MPKLIAAVALVMADLAVAAAQPAPPPPAPAPAPTPAPQGPQDPYAQPAPPAPAPYPYAYPYPPPPYGQPYAYQPPPAAEHPQPEGPGSGHLELVADFAGVGVLGTVAALDARDYHNKDSATLLVMGGALGGGAIGWLVADRFDVTRAEAHATSMGLGLGLANGALLLVPLHADDRSDQVLTTLFVSSAVGAVGGLVVGKKLSLTEGQATFAGNLALLGVGTSAMVGALIHKDGEDVTSGEMGALAIGLDAGAVSGLALAPRINWSRRRARYVGVASVAGTFVGSLVGALASSKRASDGSGSSGLSESDPDAAAAGLLIGMWGGFAAGIALTGSFAPDPALARPTAPTNTVMPMVGPGHEVGVTLAGGF